MNQGASDTPGSRWQFLLAALLTLATALLLVLLLRYHLALILMRIPLDVFEGTMPLVSGLLASVENPYAAEHQPLYTNAYPGLYNLLMAPLITLLNNTLAIHRVVSALFIGGSCALLAFVLHRRALRPRFTFAAGVLLYAGLLFYSTPLASPNSAGLFFFLCSLLLPLLASFSTRSLWLAGLCVVLAFFCKQYFALGLPILASYLFLFHSMRKALWFGGGAAVALMLSVYLVQLGSPHFIDNTILALGNIVYAIDNSQSVFTQLREFLRYYQGLLLFVAVLWLSTRGGAVTPAASGVPDRVPAAHAATSLSRPLLRRRMGLPLYSLACSALVIVFVLGRNPGNYMTYLFQLMSPFLLLVTFSFCVGRERRAGLFIPLLLWVFYSAYSWLPVDLDYDPQPWKELDQLLVENEKIFNSSILVMALLEHDRQVFHGGLSSMFPFAAGDAADRLFGAGHSRRIGEHWNSYARQINTQIEEQEFDLLILKPAEYRFMLARPDIPQQLIPLAAPRLIRAYYRKRGELELSLTERHGGGRHTLQVWERRQSSASDHDP